jgi:GNAT superfamily N-acetyltransferase
MPATLPLDLVSRFEQHVAEAVGSLLTHSLRLPGNPEGYVLFRDGPVRATLSSNPRAGWAIQTYGLGECPEALPGVVGFFHAHGVPVRARVVPGTFTTELADALHAHGLRQVAFHTMLWAPLPLAAEPPSSVDVREVTTLAEMDAHIDIQLGAYGVPADTIERLRPLRRTWLTTPGRRLYLASVDGRPAAQAILQWNDDVAYLESAGTLPAYRRRGLQQALIRRRILDADALGCRAIIGGADFESPSRTNQLACGLSVAYLAALWAQRPEAIHAR